MRRGSQLPGALERLWLSEAPGLFPLSSGRTLRSGRNRAQRGAAPGRDRCTGLCRGNLRLEGSAGRRGREAFSGSANCLPMTRVPTPAPTPGWQEPQPRSAPVPRGEVDLVAIARDVVSSDRIGADVVDVLGCGERIATIELHEPRGRVSRTQVEAAALHLASLHELVWLLRNHHVAVSRRRRVKQRARPAPRAA